VAAGSASMLRVVAWPTRHIGRGGSGLSWLLAATSASGQPSTAVCLGPSPICSVFSRSGGYCSRSCAALLLSGMLPPMCREGRSWRACGTGRSEDERRLQLQLRVRFFLVFVSSTQPSQLTSPYFIRGMLWLSVGAICCNPGKPSRPAVGPASKPSLPNEHLPVRSSCYS